MDRAVARRIFGIGESTGDERLQEAYWRLRAHLEIRLDADATEEMREAHRAELERLETALIEAAGSRDLAALVRPEFKAPPTWPRNLALAVAAIVVVVALFGRLFEERIHAFVSRPKIVEPVEPEAAQVEEPEEPEPEPAAEDRAPVWLAVKANLDEATLEVVDLESGDVAASGPADGGFLELTPGHYQLHVEHEKCPDDWQQELELAAGDRRELLAETCREQGWLIVRSNVSDDSLEIDGRSLGSTGPRELSLETGEHRIRVSKRGYQAWEAAMSVPAAETVTLSAALQPEPVVSAAAEQGQRSQPPPQQARAQPPAGKRGAAASAQPMAAPSSPSADEIQMLHDWHKTATHYLLTRYDGNRSGSLDTLDEVDAIPCDDWLGLEQSFDGSGLRLSMTRFYGFDGSKWIDRALGVTAEMRSAAYSRQKECGLR